MDTQRRFPSKIAPLTSWKTNASQILTSNTSGEPRVTLNTFCYRPHNSAPATPALSPNHLLIFVSHDERSAANSANTRSLTKACLVVPLGTSPPPFSAKSFALMSSITANAARAAAFFPLAPALVFDADSVVAETDPASRLLLPWLLLVVLVLALPSSAVILLLFAFECPSPLDASSAVRSYDRMV